MPDYARLASLDYTGMRFVLGRTAEGYAIWELASGGEPLEDFPAGQEGWAAAWLRFRELEEEAPVIRAPEVGGSAEAARPLGLGPLLEGTFKLYGRHLGPLALMVAIVTIPMALLQILVLRAFLTPELELLFSGGVNEDNLDVIRRALENELPLILATGLIVAAMSIFVSSFVTAGLIGGALRGLEGSRVHAGELLRSATGRVPSMAWVLFLTFLIIVVLALPIAGLLALAADASEGAAIILGIALVLVLLLAYARYLFAPAVLIAEDRRGGRALRRSWALTMGRTWPTLGVFLLVLLIGLIPNLLISLPFQLIAQEQESVGMFWLFSSLGGAVASAVILPFTEIAVVHLYFDARARKEQRDSAALAPGPEAGGS